MMYFMVFEKGGVDGFGEVGVFVVRREAEEREEKGGVWERGRGVWGGNWNCGRVKGMITGF